ncbi:uncharacterized protein FFB14_05248 [Fusarium fujikuroi]|nr:uncharacterized protein FFB14_05248 [Fusarium fujikuroi]
MAVPFPDSEYIDEAQTQSPGLKTTENEDLEHEVLSYFLNEPRIFIDSLGHTYSDMKSNQEPYSTYAKIVTIPRTKVQEPMTFTSRHTITLTSMATLTSFTTVFETKHLGPVDPLPKVTSKITTHITITVVKGHSISSARTSLPTTDLSPLFPPSVDANTDPSLWSTVTISDSIRSSSVLPSSFTTSRDGPKLPTGTEASSSKDSLTAGEVAPIAVGVLFLLATICLIIWFWLRSRRKRKGTSRGTQLKPILAPYRSTNVNALLTNDARHMSFELDENGRNMGLKYYKFEPSSSRHPDGHNTDLDQDPESKGKGRAE